MRTARDVVEWLRSAEGMADAGLLYIPRGYVKLIAEHIEAEIKETEAALAYCVSEDGSA